MADRYLLLIHIGPVQGFIATARRTRDLYAGSKLLSDVAYHVANRLEKECPKGLKLIFPSPSEEYPLDFLRKAGIANLIFAYIEEGECPKSPKSLAEAAKDAAKKFLLDELLKAEKRAGGVLTQQAKEIAKKQVSDLLEYYWVATPVNPGESYKSARERVYKYMAARKNVRNFEPVTWGAEVYKSSLDGALESVTTYVWKEKEINRPLSEEEKQKHQARLISLGLRPGEELSGVDIVKRLSDQPFPSTTHMAALPYLIGPGVKNAENLWNKIQKIKEEHGLQTSSNFHVPEAIKPYFKDDPRLLFPSRYREFGITSQKDLEEIRSELQSTLPDDESYAYYAILHADGDHMGKVIDALAESNEQDEEDFLSRIEDHRKLSTELAKFASRVQCIIESKKCQGSLVFSGGDDVLALLPLHTALSCAEKLAKAFFYALRKFKTKDQKSPTLSVGLAIVHHLFDLGEAVELARAAEKEAKKLRNALAITYSPRSGVKTTVSGSWTEKPPINRRLTTFASWLNQEKVPKGFAHELRQLEQELKGLDEDHDILVKEAIRILKRKAIPKDCDNDTEKLLEQWISSFTPGRIARELIVARPFAQAFKLAGITPPVEKASEEASPCQESSTSNRETR